MPSKARACLGSESSVRLEEPREPGGSLGHAIDTELNGRGILTPRGDAWHPTSAARLLAR